MTHSKKLISALCLLTLASCGGGNGGGSSSNGAREEDDFNQNQIAEGTYKAILRPTSFTLSGWVPSGMTDIKIEGDMVEVKSWLDDSANVPHMMSIHAGTKCPDLSHDANNDGFVDINELMKVSKKALIPLDGNINAQTEGSNVFPRGNFTYFQTASLASIMNDLNQSDIDSNDHVVKLRGDENLNLEGRVIVVSGVAQNRVLPPTVSTLPGLTPQASVPISCGVIMRMK